MPDLSGQNLDPLTRPQRLIAGILLLILVDVIWVVSGRADAAFAFCFLNALPLQASSEFTEYIFKDLHYDKPYFSTYFKTCLFTSYLVGFVVYAPWRQEAAARTPNVNGHYHRVQESEDEIAALPDGNDSQDEATPSTSRAAGFFRSLSSPSFVPVNIPESGKSSGTEESDVDGAAVSFSSSKRSSRRVRFKQVAEVLPISSTKHSRAR